MQDMKARLEKLRADAAECALIRDLATDPVKRELFARLAKHLAPQNQPLWRSAEADIGEAASQ